MKALFGGFWKSAGCSVIAPEKIEGWKVDKTERSVEDVRVRIDGDSERFTREGRRCG